MTPFSFIEVLRILIQVLMLMQQVPLHTKLFLQPQETPCKAGMESFFYRKNKVEAGTLSVSG